MNDLAVAGRGLTHRMDFAVGHSRPVERAESTAGARAVRRR